MRLAVVSDIHGNWTALQAVIKDLKTVGADLIVNGGDLVGNGSSPADVLDLVSDLGWPSIVGNTDAVLWNQDPLETLAERLPALASLWGVVFKDVALSREALGDERIRWLRGLPEDWRGHGTTVLHASPGDLWTAPPATADTNGLEHTYGRLESPLVVYGHIHTPFVRRLSHFILANSGSVGLSYDGDPRASYLLIDDGRPTIRRIEYDVEAEISALATGGYPYHEWLARCFEAERTERLNRRERQEATCARRQRHPAPPVGFFRPTQSCQSPPRCN